MEMEVCDSGWAHKMSILKPIKWQNRDHNSTFSTLPTNPQNHLHQDLTFGFHFTTSSSSRSFALPGGRTFAAPLHMWIPLGLNFQEWYYNQEQMFASLSCWHVSLWIIPCPACAVRPAPDEHVFADHISQQMRSGDVSRMRLSAAKPALLFAVAAEIGMFILSFIFSSVVEAFHRGLSSTWQGLCIQSSGRQGSRQLQMRRAMTPVLYASKCTTGFATSSVLLLLLWV